MSRSQEIAALQRRTFQVLSNATAVLEDLHHNQNELAIALEGRADELELVLEGGCGGWASSTGQVLALPADVDAHLASPSSVVLARRR